MIDYLPVPFKSVVLENIDGFLVCPAYFTVFAAAAIAVTLFTTIRSKVHTFYKAFAVLNVILVVWVVGLVIAYHFNAYIKFMSPWYAYWMRHVIPIDWYIYIASCIFAFGEGLYRRSSKWVFIAIGLGLVVIIAHGLHSTAIYIASRM